MGPDSSAHVILGEVDHPPKMPGKLIVLEGLDRAGKTTQVELVRQKLHDNNVPVEYIKFPDRTTAIGKMINQYLTSSDATLPDESIHLLFSANRWELNEKMRNHLKNGTWLVVDRYVYSGAAFSSAKGLDLEWCRAPDSGLPEPDLVVFLDVSSEVAQTRGGYGEERYEQPEFQAKVRSEFEKLRSSNWRWISADGSVESVSKTIWDAVSELL